MSEDHHFFKREMDYLNNGGDIGSVWKRLDANGVLIFVRFYTTSDKMGSVRDHIKMSLYDLFVQNDISLPVPDYIRIEEQD